MAILQQMNLYQMEIYRLEANIAANKMEIAKLDWQLKELRDEYRNGEEDS